MTLTELGHTKTLPPAATSVGTDLMVTRCGVLTRLRQIEHSSTVEPTGIFIDSAHDHDSADSNTTMGFFISRAMALRSTAHPAESTNSSATGSKGSTRSIASLASMSTVFRGCKSRSALARMLIT